MLRLDVVQPTLPASSFLVEVDTVLVGHAKWNGVTPDVIVPHLSVPHHHVCMHGCGGFADEIGRFLDSQLEREAEERLASLLADA